MTVEKNLDSKFFSKDDFYNGNYSIITKEKLESKYTGFVNVFGEDKKTLKIISDSELYSDKQYNGHIVWNIPRKDPSLELLSSIVSSNKLTHNNIFCYDIHHDGVDSKCYIDYTILFCSSWVLPFVLNNNRTSNSLYGDIAARRVNIQQLKYKKLL